MFDEIPVIKGGQDARQPDSVVPCAGGGGDVGMWRPLPLILPRDNPSNPGSVILTSRGTYHLSCKVPVPVP
jgi:hypothetical protein